MARPIIIDTDPGQDDAVAILLALASPELDVLGVTAVAGNVPLALTEANARKICELAGRADVRVFAGHDAPLERKLVTAEHVHGRTGLDGADLPPPRMPLQDAHAVDFIVETIRARPAGEVALCPLGPLTNIAAALKRAPEIAPKIGEIVLMGGGYFEQGNITPSAEFNIYVDPEAAEIVLRCGAPVTMIPLDCTHRALTNRARVDAFRALGTPVGAAVAGLTDFFERFDRAKYGTEGAPLHDPCVIAYLLEPDLFSGRLVNVEVETKSPLTLGSTVADWWGVT
ncbi:MAG: nucleoside hydrolase, partial [Pseudomonadota bacterium]